MDVADRRGVHVHGQPRSQRQFATRHDLRHRLVDAPRPADGPGSTRRRDVHGDGEGRRREDRHGPPTVDLRRTVCAVDEHPVAGHESVRDGRRDGRWVRLTDGRDSRLAERSADHARVPHFELARHCEAICAAGDGDAQAQRLCVQPGKVLPQRVPRSGRTDRPGPEVHPRRGDARAERGYHRVVERDVRFAAGDGSGPAHDAQELAYRGELPAHAVQQPVEDACRLPGFGRLLGLDGEEDAPVQVQRVTLGRQRRREPLRKVVVEEHGCEVLTLAGTPPQPGAAHVVVERPAVRDGVAHVARDFALVQDYRRVAVGDGHEVALGEQRVVRTGGVVGGQPPRRAPEAARPGVGDLQAEARSVRQLNLRVLVGGRVGDLQLHGVPDGAALG